MNITTAIGRFAGGAAGAAAGIANKYIDDEILQQRQQAFLDMQRESSLRSERELDAQRNDPTRLARDRENKRQDTLASAAATREAATAGVNDVGYQGALDQASLMETRRRIEAENAVTEGTKGARLSAETERLKALLPFEKEKAEALADIQASRQIRVGNALAEAATRREDSRARNAMAEKLGAIESFMGRKLTEDEKLVLVGIQKKGGDEGLNKLAMEAATKALEAQQIKPEEVGPYANRVLQGFQAVRVGAGVAAGINKARTDGKLDVAVKEFVSEGMSIDQLKPYLSDDEFKRFAPAKRTEPSVGGFIMDIARRSGRALAPDLNAHAESMFGLPADKRRIEQLIAMDDDNPSKPLSPENRQKLLQMLGR